MNLASRAVQVSSFEQNSECYFLVVDNLATASLAVRLEHLYASLKQSLTDHGLTAENVVFSRVFFSDIKNQYPDFEKSKLAKVLFEGACSCIEQAPLYDSSKLAVLCYALKPLTSSLKKTTNKVKNHCWVQGSDHDYYFGCNQMSEQPNPALETEAIFKQIIADHQQHQLTLLQNLVRTWIFISDVDRNYSAMVKSRAQLFREQNLTPQTRFIASTGIEGRTQRLGITTSIDCFSIGGLKPQQMQRMHAPSHLGPTEDYGVTFDRGTRVDFKDRSHFYISGTASIDTAGNVLHLGDCRKQTTRAIANVKALLEAQGADLCDLKYLIVYLRDASDSSEVSLELAEHFKSSVPIVMVRGAVCRPEWLVEIEGVAIKATPSQYGRFL